MTCLFDTRWDGTHGIGRFSRELSARLPCTPLEAKGRPMSPVDPLRLSGLSWDSGDWLLSPGYNAPLIGALPYILTVHDLNHLDRSENSSTLKRIYYKRVLRRLCRRSRAVLTVSEFSRRRIIDGLSVDPAYVFNVGNGVSPAFSMAGARREVARPYLLCVSNRRGHKNEMRTLGAFAQSGLAGKIDMVFTGHETEALRRHACDLGIGSNLTFAGQLSEMQLAAFYRGATALVFASLYEGFGLPIIEAFACGVPVITSNVTSMPEIAGDAAVLVDPMRPAHIASAMQSMVESVDLRGGCVARGVERVKDFSWDSVARRVMSTVERVGARDGRALCWSGA